MTILETVSAAALAKMLDGCTRQSGQTPHG